MLAKLVMIDVYTSICVGDRCDTPSSTLCIDKKAILAFSRTVAYARHEYEAKKVEHKRTHSNAEFPPLFFEISNEGLPRVGVNKAIHPNFFKGLKMGYRAPKEEGLHDLDRSCAGVCYSTIYCLTGVKA